MSKAHAAPATTKPASFEAALTELEAIVLTHCFATARMH